jgi:hypothetical protein
MFFFEILNILKCDLRRTAKTDDALERFYNNLQLFHAACDQTQEFVVFVQFLYHCIIKWKMLTCSSILCCGTWMVHANPSLVCLT